MVMALYTYGPVWLWPILVWPIYLWPYLVMANVEMACIVMVYIVMTLYSYGQRRDGLYSYGPLKSAEIRRSDRA